jgi:AmmeMemoRadiSam system protein B
MVRSALAPKLRPLEVVFVPDAAHGRRIVLRDTEGVAPGAVSVPEGLGPVLALLDGSHSYAAIAARASAAGARVDAALVEELAQELDRALLLDTPRYHARRREIVDEFASARVRPAAHAGGAYPGGADALVRYIEDECLARAPAAPRAPRGRMVGLCATHMDLWRAAEGYGHAYRALQDGLDARVDTIVLLGTSHAPMTQPFALCAKAFDTPLGALAPDDDAIAELAGRARFDALRDEFVHRKEHAIELQAVFLRHALGARAAEVRTIPVLCGLGAAQASGRDPASDAEAESFVAALADLVARRADRTLVVAGADLAHVGPRFGDAAPLTARGRERLRAVDAESVELAVQRDAPGFFRHVARDLHTRRVCGLGPIYTALRVLPDALGHHLHYDQHVDRDEGSVVSHAAIGWYARDSVTPAGA